LCRFGWHTQVQRCASAAARWPCVPSESLRGRCVGAAHVHRSPPRANVGGGSGVACGEVRRRPGCRVHSQLRPPASAKCGSAVALDGGGGGSGRFFGCLGGGGGAGGGGGGARGFFCVVAAGGGRRGWLGGPGVRPERAGGARHGRPARQALGGDGAGRVKAAVVARLRGGRLQRRRREFGRRVGGRRGCDKPPGQRLSSAPAWPGSLHVRTAVASRAAPMGADRPVGLRGVSDVTR